MRNIGERNPRFVPRTPEGGKRCTKCRQFKAPEAFSRDRSRFDGLTYCCKECRNAAARQQHEKAERTRFRESGLTYCRGCKAWLPAAEVGPARLCRVHAREFARERYRSDLAHRMARRQHARSRKRGIDPIPIDIQTMILEQFRGRCAYCQAPATTWDHVVPIVKGGTSEQGNVVPACQPCNSSKRDRNVWEWMESTGRRPSDELAHRLIHHFVAAEVGPDPLE